jgi:hypothetical protein
MTTQFTSATTEFAAELMELLLDESTDNNYPWNPAAPESADYYAAMDEQFSLDDWSEEEITTRSDAFFSTLSACWADAPSAETEEVATTAPVSLIDRLSQKFADRVPQNLLASIATKASQVATAPLEIEDKLVQSVRDLLSNWSVDDLSLFARPYAYAMRCDAGIENPSNVSRDLPWEELNETEKAKLTILIAQYAIELETKA